MRASVPGCAAVKRIPFTRPSELRTISLVAVTGVHHYAELLDPRAQGRRASVVDLGRHQAGRELHHVGLQTEALQGIGSFEPEQPSADHRADLAAAVEVGIGADRLEVVDGAVHEATPGVAPGTGGTKGYDPVARTSAS